jgi:hypothetical protein
MESVPDARLVTLRDNAILGWTDLVAECTDEIGSAMLDFLAQRLPGAQRPSLWERSRVRLPISLTVRE